VNAFGRGAHACRVCGAIYPREEEARQCEAFAVRPEEIPARTLVEARGAAPETGLGLVTGSFLLGLGDPRGEAHTRLFRVNFIWGRADFRAEDLIPRGPATEAEWRALVEEGGRRKEGGGRREEEGGRRGE
jgi:hypothetical protein